MKNVQGEEELREFFGLSFLPSCISLKGGRVP